jgi:hypothetical protein
MENSPNECDVASAGEALREQCLIDPPFCNRRDDQKQTPDGPAEITGERRRQQPARGTDAEDNARGDAPAAIARVTQPGDPHEQDERRNDRDKKQNMVKIEHEKSM